MRTRDESKDRLITLAKYLDKCGSLRGLHAQQHCLQEFWENRQDCLACFAHEVNDKITNEQSPRLFLTL